MARLNNENRNVIFQSGYFKIRPELSPYNNEIIGCKFTASF